MLLVSLLFPQLDEFSEDEEEEEEEEDDDESSDYNARPKLRNATIKNGKNTLKARDTVGSLGFNGQRKVWFVLPSVFCVF